MAYFLDLNKTIEHLKDIEKAEQKARDIADFSIYISQKWESRLARKKEPQSWSPLPRRKLRLWLMNKPLSDMNNTELRQYLSQNRHDEQAFSQALEILLDRKKNLFKYPPPSQMNYQEIEDIFKKEINQK